MAEKIIQQSGSPTPEAVAIVGAGSIGAAWAIVLAEAGLEVRLQDTDSGRLAAATSEIASRLEDLRGFGLTQASIDDTRQRIRCCGELGEAVAGVIHVQECAPENLALKQQVFAELDRLAPADAVLASSSSFLPASQFAGELAGRHRVLVLHPANPPYLLRVAEVVPAPFTSQACIDRTIALMRRARMEPVLLNKEADGFVFNRLQGALLREAYCLVRDGVVSSADIDRLMRDGLGLRWSLLGPFETVHLNTRGGITAHAERMGPAYLRMGQQRGQNDPWTADMVAAVAADLEVRRPMGNWESAVAWRDRALMALLRQRNREPVLEPSAGAAVPPISGKD